MMAEKRFYVHKSVIEKISELSENKDEEGKCVTCNGFLYGISAADSLSVTSATYHPSLLKSGTVLSHFNRSRCTFPVGVDPLGVFLCNCDVTELTNIIPMGSVVRMPEELVCVVINGGEEPSLHYYNRLTKELNTLDYSTITGNPYSDHVLIRLTSSVDVSYKFSTKQSEMKGNYMNALQSVIKSMASCSVYYNMLETDVLLSSQEVNGAQSTDTVDKILKQIRKRRSEDEPRRGKNSSAEFKHKVLQVEILKKMTLNSDEPSAASPVIHYSKSDDMMICVSVPIDSVSLVPVTISVGELSSVLYRSLVRNLHSTQDVLEDVVGTDVPDMEMLHFWPDGLNFPLSLMFKTLSKDQDLIQWRRDLHTRLMLPQTRPLFRRANRFLFPSSSLSSQHLLNPHVGLSLPKQLDLEGNVHTVYGKYTYHHYMQDNFNDDKWGCAYRSLQTLISWFNLQGYSSVNIPTHREIQQILVDIGDKEPSFVGSQQWIGSTEVGFVLDKLLGVTSKILHVSSGAELASKGRELVYHFHTQGTPVMIGGGVLAHTILGVYYNSQTGDIRFLILDPHYTGADDLKTIQDKGWCGWKKEDFWVPNVYYNMCMPQRPSAI